MAIPRALIKLLMREGKREKFFGKILTIGKQHVYASESDLHKWAKELEFELKTGITVSHKEDFAEIKSITDDSLFLSLGFDNINSMDYSTYEKCTIVHDLNEDVPETLHNNYDLIFDSGSSEHIFNIPKVFENYCKMLKTGGRIIIFSPSSNHVDHGFYMFSPTLFYDYYTANKWDIVDSLFIRYFRNHVKKLWHIYKYTAGCLERHSFGGLNKGLYGNFFILRKTSTSTFNAPIQQGYYLKTWNKMRVEASKSWRKNILRKIPISLKKVLVPAYDQFMLTLPLRLFLKLIVKY